jgi:hypothetical protein
MIACLPPHPHRHSGTTQLTTTWTTAYLECEGSLLLLSEGIGSEEKVSHDEAPTEDIVEEAEPGHGEQDLVIEGGDGSHLTLARFRIRPLEFWVLQLLRSVLQATGEAILMLLLPECRVLRCDGQKLHGEAEDHQDYQNSCQVKRLRG